MWRPGDSGEDSMATVLGESAAQAWREEKRSGERCSPFIGGPGLLGVEMPVSNGR
jgi:hypothetical protein